MLCDESERPCTKILVYGVTGSGKTTLAERVAERTGLPWFAIDDLTWEPGWVQVPDEEQRRRIEEICTRPEWVIDAAYAKWLHIPLQHVELIVALDYPRWVSLTRLIRRSVARAVDGKTICNGNRESFLGMFSKDSIILWHFKSFNSKRIRIEKWCKSENSFKLIRLRSPRDADKFLDSPRPTPSRLFPK